MAAVLLRSYPQTGARIREHSAPGERPRLSQAQLGLQMAREAAQRQPRLGDESDSEYEWSGDEEDGVASWDGDESESDQDDASTGGNNEDDKDEEAITLVLSNIPSEYSRTRVLSLLSSEGFATDINFFFMPALLTTGESVGHAFVNFTTPAAAKHFRFKFAGFRAWELQQTPPMRKPLAAKVTHGAPQQGLEANIEAYRNDMLMHSIVPEEFKPILLMDGQQVPFPAPTRPLIEPVIRVRRANS
mmetsp:Transcript_83034/g.220291  ORF Transcript_83034/g.220291 Transcript_83034/m.220291 type:complete len:245 (-) Transcript_83034:88-822(-)